MSKPQQVRVALGDRSYDIFIGAGLLDRARQFLAPLRLGPRGVIITDSHVGPRYAARLRRALANDAVGVLTIPAGEASKSLRHAYRLLEQLPTFRLERNSFVIALGGGVVGDLAGFVAATYLRGIPFVQIPTSLLAMVDSSVGGKTGVNLPQGKNLVGAFHQPRLVLVDTDLLRTLPKRELRAGFAEVIKAAAIADARFFTWLERNHRAVLALQPAAVRGAVRRCCEIKADVVSQDERESGLRAILNFGHTIGHALEAVGGYSRWLHGEAVALGMVAAAELSVKHTGLPPAAADRLKRLIRASRLPSRLPNCLDSRPVLAAIKLDKKVMAGRLRFVLLPRLGKSIVTDAVTEADVMEALHVCR